MKPKLLNSLGRAVAACLFASLAAAAQEAPPPQQAAAQTRLVVQVEYFKEAPPSYQPVPGGSWYGRFGTVAPPSPRAAADTVRAVDVKTRLEGERVEIRVGVHVGERHFDRLDVVGTYSAAVGDTVTASELEGVGVVPFVFKVLRVNDAEAAPPAVVNKTQSIEAAITEFTPTPLPRGKLTLRNLSSKRVRAVLVRQIVAGRNRLTGYAMAREGRMAIEPGGTFEKMVGATTGGTSGGNFTPEAVETVVVASALFDDYTYEGEAEPAASKRAFDEGERAQLPRLMALVREANAAPDAETPRAVQRFRDKLSALGYEAPQSAVDAVLKSFPELKPEERDGIRTAIEVSMHGLRRDLLDDLAAFEKKRQASPAENSFKGWLKAKQAFFEEWLSRL